MTLVGRLTAFFLVALAIVLVGFSITLFVLMRGDLDRGVSERLESALDTMAAVAEVTPEGVEWETQQSRLQFGQDTDDTQVRWVVYDGQGAIVDRSRNVGVESLPAVTESTTHEIMYNGHTWRLHQRRLVAGGTSNADATDHGKPETKYPVLILRVGLSLDPLHAALRKLAIVLSLLSLGVWLLAALLSRRLCRRALRPLTQMADAARSMQATDLAQRLPASETGDELQDLGQAFNDLLARLQEAFERQARFTGDASHQLRTPLAAMLGHVGVALRRERSIDEYQQVLGVVSEQGRRLQSIVEMLLFLARSDTEALSPTLTSLPIEPWLRDHLLHWEAHPRGSDIRLAASDDRPMLARVHAPLFGQVLDVLLDNACKFSSPGTPIIVSCHRNGKGIELAVEDRGRGIDDRDLPHVFDAFYQSPVPANKYSAGVGLGLAIARRVTQAMGGGIDVASKLGHGSRFVVWLQSGSEAT